MGKVMGREKEPGSAVRHQRKRKRKKARARAKDLELVAHQPKRKSQLGDRRELRWKRE